MNTRTRLPRAMTLAFALLAAQHAGAAPNDKPAPAESAGVFARVGDTAITYEEYNNSFAAAMRAKYFHGKPPEKEVAQLQRDVADRMVERILLLNEARARGIKPASAEIEKTIQTYDQRYAGSEQWKANRAKMVPQLTAKLEQESLLEQLEKAVRATPPASDKEARAYYAAHPEKFTEPEQVRVSVILLKVDPSSPRAVWEKANEEAKGILRQLQGGADFATVARERSGDGSAKQGGDLGYLHKGMLPEGTEEIVGKLKIGELSDTLPILDGVAIFRVTDRKVARLNDFERVRVRAGELLQRDRSDQQWQNFLAALKKKTPAQIDQSKFLPLPAAVGSHTDAGPAAKAAASR